jgi:hypothetical protein
METGPPIKANRPKPSTNIVTTFFKCLTSYPNKDQLGPQLLFQQGLGSVNPPLSTLSNQILAQTCKSVFHVTNFPFNFSKTQGQDSKRQAREPMRLAPIKVY